MTRRWALALVVALSLLTHLKGLSAPPYDYHYHRQVNTAAIARNFAEHGRRLFRPQIDWAGNYRGLAATEFPLYMWLVGVFWPLFWLGATWGRILSALFSALAAVYLFLFLERRFSRKEALASALFFSLIPLNIYFGRTIQPEALALAAGLAAMYHWERFLDDASELHWGLAVFAAFLAIGHKLPYGYLLLVLAIQAYLKKGWKAFKDQAVLVAPALCLAAVFAWYKYASRGAYVVPTGGDQFRKLLDYGKLAWYVWFQFTSRLPELTATWPGVALAVAGAFELRRRKDALFFGLWFAAVALYIVAGGGYTFFHEYTSLPYTPITASLMGPGFFWAYGKARSMGARAFLAVLVLALPITSVFRIKHWYHQNFPYLAHAHEAADAISHPADLFIGNDRAASLFLYAMHRRGWGWNVNEGDGLVEIEAKIKQGAAYLATSATELTPAMRLLLKDRFPRVYDADGLEIYRLDGRSPAIELLRLGGASKRK